MEKQTNFISKVFSSEGTTECVTLTEVKTHLYIDTANTDFDTRLTALISEARQYIEQITGRSLISRTVTAYFNYESEFGLPFGPLVSFTSAAAKDDVNSYETQTLNSDYEVEAERFISYVGNWKYKLVYTVGYMPTTIPLGLKLALLNEIAKRFEHRGDEVQVLDTNDLIIPYKDLEWLV